MILFKNTETVSSVNDDSGNKLIPKEQNLNAVSLLVRVLSLKD